MELVPEPEDSSPVLTWILGYFWSLPRGVSPRLEWGHARALSFRAVAAVSHFTSCVSMDQGLSLEAFPRGFPTGLSHVPPWCESILGLKFQALQGKQVSLELTEISGGLWEWWHDPGVPLAPFLWRAPPLEMRRECRVFFPEHAVKGSPLSSYRRKPVSSGCGRDSRASCRVETDMLGNFLSCSKGVKDPL